MGSQRDTGSRRAAQEALKALGIRSFYACLQIFGRALNAGTISRQTVWRLWHEAPLKAKTTVPVVEAMLRVHPGGKGAYIYGPICVARSERGYGLAARLFAALRMQLPGREGVLFIRRDNAASLRAHLRMGMQQVGEFTHCDVVHAVLAYQS